MLLLRTVTKQVLARIGYHASFMALPGLPGFDPSGWHLHQSLAERSTGRNLFAAGPGENVLSEAGDAGHGEGAPPACTGVGPTGRALGRVPARLSGRHREALVRISRMNLTACFRIAICNLEGFRWPAEGSGPVRSWRPSGPPGSAPRAVRA